MESVFALLGVVQFYEEELAGGRVNVGGQALVGELDAVHLLGIGHLLEGGNGGRHGGHMEQTSTARTGPEALESGPTLVILGTEVLGAERLLDEDHSEAVGLRLLPRQVFPFVDGGVEQGLRPHASDVVLGPQEHGHARRDSAPHEQAPAQRHNHQRARPHPDVM